ncbi:MAG: metalloregulator ArsR/SmtB family transcription factor [Paludisphaera borealis]|uniref:ArsR/SmtB family transcription factor n=1 Tax=Paludisphaera borealis TaxID=1387353 RepID=UPI00284A3954|nr:metalloregulator ArsR/SmtB family transcription factor [Paludisphaera borealis]MDR3622813.1 metalloregulator ArsR/SmtB family transcription factor [Paludisphaera borealis]
MKTPEKRAFKARLFGEFARIGKALSSPHRLQLIEVLSQGERTVEQLAEDVGAPVANVSQHLQVLKTAMLVSVRREGLYAHYSLADPGVFRVWQALRDLGQARLSEVDAVVSEYFGDRSKMDAVDAGELRRRLGDVIVLDVRPRLEYEAGHIRGARSVPFDELADRLRELPPNVEIVAYCRGPYCVFADEAVAALRAKGYRALRLSEGYPDWRQRGFPSESGAEPG